jgi:hypothetical protein
MRWRREVLSAFRYAPKGDRLRLAREIVTLPQSGLERPSSVAAVYEVKSLAQFEKVSAALAKRLNQSVTTSASSHMRNLQMLERRRQPFPGIVGHADFYFLAAFVSALSPERVVELGTLTGFSAAVLAAAIIAERGYHGNPVVETIDPATECMVAPEPVGFEIPRLLPEYPGAVRVHSGHDSRILPQLFRAGELAVAFVDANHQHPFPLLDTLRLAPFLRPNAWIILHDITLGTIGAQMRARGEPVPYGAPYGAEMLFDAWPFPKISGGNTGAIQLPKARRDLLPFALCLMRKRFEGGRARQHRKLRRMLYQALVPLAAAK